MKASSDILTVAERILKVTDRITHLVGLIDVGGPDAQIVSRAAEILHILRDNGLLYKISLHSKHVGVHPENRYGDGVVPLAVHELIENISHHGWCWHMVEDALAVEQWPHGSAEAKERIVFNEKQCDESDGMLPPFAADDIRILSVKCGHTNAGLRCAHFGAPTPIASIAEDGKVSKRKLADRNEQHGIAIDKGMTWDVIPHEVEKAFPTLLNAFQESGNAAQMISNSETPEQVLKKIFKEAKKLEKNADDGSIYIDWARVRARVLRVKPPCAADVPDMCEFVKLFAGTDGALLTELEEFVHGLRTARSVSGQTYGHIAKVDLKGPLAANFRMGCVKACKSAPAKYTSNGEATLLSPSDFSSMSGKVRSLVLQADQRMVQAKQLMQDPLLSGVAHERKAALINVHDVRLVMHTFSKTDPDRKSFDNLNAISHDFLLSTKDLLSPEGGRHTLVSPWTAEPTKATTKTPPAAPSGLTVYTSTGVMTNFVESLARQGLVVNGRVKATKEADEEGEYIVDSVTSDTVTLSSVGEKRTKMSVSASDILFKYSVVKPEHAED